jgi:hypothetical protein
MLIMTGTKSIEGAGETVGGIGMEEGAGEKVVPTRQSK